MYSPLALLALPAAVPDRPGVRRAHGRVRRHPGQGRRRSPRSTGSAIVPLFLFSGTFFPDPPAAELAAGGRRGHPALPRGVALPDLTLGRSWWADLGHVAYLLALTAVGVVAGRHHFRPAAGGVSGPGPARPGDGAPSRRGRCSSEDGRAVRGIVERNILVYRRGWVFMVSGFFEPFFYLLSIGVGLASLVGALARRWADCPLHRLRRARDCWPSSAMNGAIFDSTFNIFFKLKIAKTYDAMLSTPMGVGDMALGELAWALHPRGRVLRRLPGGHGRARLRGVALGGAVLPGRRADQPSPSPRRRHGRAPRTCAAGRTSTWCRWPSYRSSSSRPPSIR